MRNHLRKRGSRTVCTIVIVLALKPRWLNNLRLVLSSNLTPFSNAVSRMANIYEDVQERNVVLLETIDVSMTPHYWI